MCKIYNLIWEDTRVDTEVYSFSILENALKFMLDGLKDCYIDNDIPFEINKSICDDNDLSWLFSVYGESFSMRLGEFKIGDVVK